MSTLKIDKLTCIQTTSGSGSDRIYMVVVIGRRSGSKKAELESSTIVSGTACLPAKRETKTPSSIRRTTRSDFYLGAMVERDSGQDVQQLDFNELPGLWQWFEPVEFKMNEGWQTWGVSVQGLTDDQIAAKLVHTMNSLVGGAGDDDLVGSAKLLPKPKAGQTETKTFAGDGGKYEASFNVVN